MKRGEAVSFPLTSNGKICGREGWSAESWQNETTLFNRTSPIQPLAVCTAIVVRIVGG